MLESDNEKAMTAMLNSLVIFIAAKKMQWIVICDQHNALFRNTLVVDQFPFNIISLLSSKRCSEVKVIISASANNKGYPTELKGWLTHDIPNMAVKLPPPSVLSGMDRQILDIIADESGGKVITALTPVARRILLDFMA